MVMHVYKMVRNGVEYAPRTIAKAVSMEDGTSLDVAMSKSQSPYAGVTTNIGNAYSIASPVISELKEGMAVRVKINNDSTGASTLDWNGKGAKGIKKANGSDVTNLKAGGIYTLVYGGVNFQLQGEGGEYGTAEASDVLAPKTIGTDSGLVTGTLALTGSAVEADVLAGKTFYKDAVQKKTGTMVDRGTVSTDITTKAQQVTIAAGKHSGTGIVKISATEQAKVIAGNIKSGVTLLGQAGSLSPRLYATGTATASGSSYNYLLADDAYTYAFYRLLVSYSFGFTPLYVFVLDVEPDGRKRLQAVYNDLCRVWKEGNSANGLIKYSEVIKNGAAGSLIRLTSDGGTAYVNSTGFNLPVDNNYNSKQWIALG